MGTNLIPLLVTLFAIFSRHVIGAPLELESLLPRSLFNTTEEYVGYGFFYFTGNLPGQEQVYTAVSRGNTPTSWDLVKGGRPVITSRVGTRGIRDPTVVRSVDGSKLYMLATDLNIGSGTTFGEAATRGSKSLVFSESSDGGATWTRPVLRKIADPEAGCVWAPDVLYNPSTRSYDIYYTSFLYDGPFYFKIMKTSTRDFVTFTKPTVYLDRPGYSIIDLTFLKANDGRLYRFIKNEVPTRDQYPFSVYQEVSDDGPDGEWKRVVDDIGRGMVGRIEGPTAFMDNQNPERAWVFMDEYNRRGYVTFSTQHVASAKWKLHTSADLPLNHARHGTVLPLTAREYKALRARVIDQ